MKIAVYTIALNEEQFVSRWAESARKADCMLVADTGSSDRTVEICKEEGITVHSISVKPWRFDDARNAALALLPPDIDYCISVDMDEVLSPEWRDSIESQMPGYTRGHFMYVWSHLEDGSNGVHFWYDKIHARHGYHWVNPVHEVLVPQQITETSTNVHGFELHHWADPTKSRAQYLPLLELAVKENSRDARSQHYYGRELMFYGHNEQAIEELKKHLLMPEASWDAERCASMRFIARCLMRMDKNDEAIVWQRKACVEAPHTREPWVEYAQSMYRISDWPQCFSAIMNALKVTDQPSLYINEVDAWNWLPHDLAAISAYHLGMKDIAIAQGVIAMQKNPDDKRLADNMLWYVEDYVEQPPLEGRVEWDDDGEEDEKSPTDSSGTVLADARLIEPVDDATNSDKDGGENK